MTSVLVLHVVTDGSWLDDMLGWLKRRFECVSADTLMQLVQASDGRTDRCHITVDDGHETFMNVIFPLLCKHRIPASLFVSPAICREGGRFWFQQLDRYADDTLRCAAEEACEVPQHSLRRFRPVSILKSLTLSDIRAVLGRCQHGVPLAEGPNCNMSEKELRQVAKSGFVSIGAHTINHPILANEDDDTSRQEIVRSVNELTNLLQTPVSSFAYPNGIPAMDFGDRELRALSDAGVRTAFTTSSRHVSANQNPLMIPRVSVSDGEPLARIRSKLLLGASWACLKQLAPNKEYAERRRIQAILSSFHRRGPIRAS